jgi:predicted aspartyl protease
MKLYRLVIPLTALMIMAGGCVRLSRSTAPAAVRPGEVRIEMAGPNGAAVLVPVTINGQGPFKFVLDTGATMTTIEPSLAGSLGLREAVGARGYGAGIGGAGAIKLVQAESVQMGTASAKDIMLGVVDLQALKLIGPEVKGLIGLNFLKPYRMTIDFQRQTLQLETP